ncbi:MAG: BlaI/MecI/CopY family transcriptional regulator [Firmicutes bacterium]|nr:BlaI/MecI/CopY family transcriptional regulator [Bacillota bacterium]
MKKLPQISDAEYQVMKVIWRHAPINTNQVVKSLEPVSSWNPKTIQTLLLRLVKKGALAKEKDGRMFVYTPIVLEEEYRTDASRNFLEQFYNGAISSMVQNFIRQDQISDEEIRQLKEILDEKEASND